MKNLFVKMNGKIKCNDAFTSGNSLQLGNVDFSYYSGWVEHFVDSDVFGHCRSPSMLKFIEITLTIKL